MSKRRSRVPGMTRLRERREAADYENGMKILCAYIEAANTVGGTPVSVTPAGREAYDRWAAENPEKVAEIHARVADDKDAWISIINEDAS